jgi:hypothetical protein
MKEMEEKEFTELKRDVVEEIVAIITDRVNDSSGSAIRDTQPTESVIWEMAQAAASVLIAFERGYRLGS